MPARQAHPLVRALALVLGALLLSPAALAQSWEQVADGIDARMDVRWPEGLSRGYVPVRVEFRSGRAEETVVVARSLFGPDDALTETSVAGLLPPGESTTLELPVLVGVLHTDDVQVFAAAGSRERWVGSYVRDRFNDYKGVVVVSERSRAAGWPADREQLLSDGKLPSAPAFEPLAPGSAAPLAWRSGMRLDELVHPDSKAQGRPGADCGAYAVAVVGGLDLPRNLACYTSLGAVVVDGDAPPGGADLGTALRWMRAGGTVVLTGDDPGQLSRALLADEALEPRFEIARIGRVRILRHGLGYLLLAPGPALEEQDQLAALRWVLERTPRWVPSVPIGHSPFLPESGIDTRPPVAVLLTIVLLFTIVVGPLNFAYARRKRQPVLVLFSIPLLSVAVAILLTSYGVVRDGIGLKSATESIAVLDQRLHEVGIATAREVFAGLASSREARPGAGTVVVPAMDRGDDDRSARYRVAFGGGAAYSGDFLGTRSIRRLRTIEQRSMRLRLDLRPEGDGWRATNGLEVDLTDLVFRDASGSTFAAEGVAAGADALLQPATEEQVDATLDALGVGDGTPLADALLPGTYAALVDGDGLLDDLGVGGREIESNHGLIGIVDWSAAGGTR